MVTLPEKVPAAVGRKRTSNVPWLFGAMPVVMLGDGFVIANGSDVAISEMTRLAVPVFESVT